MGAGHISSSLPPPDTCCEHTCFSNTAFAHLLVSISCKDRVTNEEVRAKVQPAIGPQEDLLTIVMRRKLQWYGHVSLSSGLAKAILQSPVKGERRQGRQKKRWEDNIREWPDRPGVRQVPEGSREQGKQEETGCEIIRGAPNDPRG